MNIKKIVNEINKSMDWPLKWHDIVLILSLDYAVPFWEDIGLYIKHKKAIQKISRNAFLEYQNGEQSFYNAHYTNESAKKIIRKYIESLYEVDIESCLKILNWGSFYFCKAPFECPIESAWISTFSYISYLGFSEIKNSLKMNSIKRDLVFSKMEDFFEKKQIKLFKIEKSRGTRTTKWDNSILGNFELDEFDLNLITFLIEITYFRKFWSEINVMLSKAELKEFFIFYKKYAEIVHIPKKNIKVPDVLKWTNSIY